MRWPSRRAEVLVISGSLILSRPGLPGQVTGVADWEITKMSSRCTEGCLTLSHYLSDSEFFFSKFFSLIHLQISKISKKHPFLSLTAQMPFGLLDNVAQMVNSLNIFLCVLKRFLLFQTTHKASSFLSRLQYGPE